MKSRYFCFSVNPSSGSLSGTERRCSASVPHSPSIFTANRQAKLQDLPGSRLSRCPGLTYNSPDFCSRTVEGTGGEI